MERVEARADDRHVDVVDDESGVVVITIDRPAVRNALADETLLELDDAFARCADDDAVAAVVLTGAGAAFCAGGDLRAPRRSGHGALGPAWRIARAERAVLTLATMRKPTIAAVEGPAVGAGWGLAQACDLVVAARDAFFAAPFVLRGLVPDGGTAWFLTQALGRHRASELLLLGERLSAPDAAQAGLVNRLVEPGTALDSALELARRLAAGPADALAFAKFLVRRSTTSGLESVLEDELASAALNLHGPDSLEGRRAFAEKRAPAFARRPAPQSPPGRADAAADGRSRTP
jgi:2-(1,2-epoxy-1,2-dihydrophenyl)acetyl-CoA isomerase